MSPEVIADKEYGSDADIWSFGCVIYELFTGERPFKVFNNNDIYFKIFNYSNPIECASEEIQDKIYSKENRELLKILLMCWKSCNIRRASSSELLENSFFCF